MEYQKIANLLGDNKTNQPSKFRTKIYNIGTYKLIVKLSLKLQC